MTMAFKVCVTTVIGYTETILIEIFLILAIALMLYLALVAFVLVSMYQGCRDTLRYPYSRLLQAFSLAIGWLFLLFLRIRGVFRIAHAA